MPGTLQYNLSDYQEAARTYRADLLRLPILALAPTLQYMTLRPGVRYEEVVGATSVDVELRPYVRNDRQNVNLDLKLRKLRTYFGSVNADFDPNDAISTLLGHKASQASGDALATTPQAHEVIALTPKEIGRKLARCIFSAKHDPAGKTTADLFDGFDTITETEIAAGAIAASEGNYILLEEKPSKLNAVDIAHSILEAMDPDLREEDCYLFCDVAFADAYNRAYKMESGGIIYNTEFNKIYVEGSMNRLQIVPLAGKAGSKFIHVTPKRNMLVGVDQMSDLESVRVRDYEPDTLTLMLRMFFGTQFESIDPRRLLCAEIPA